jgi:hypothetical protein
VRTRNLLLAACVAVAACNEDQYVRAPPTDAFVFPTAVGIYHVTPGPDGERQLLVVSSNFDLNYDPKSGGTLMSLAAAPATLDVAPGQLGVIRTPSFGGPVVVADAETCPGLGRTEAYVATRYTGELVRATVTPAGALECPPGGCAVPLSGAVDPFGVELACRGESRKLFLSYLARSSGYGLISEFDLNDPALPRTDYLLRRPADFLGEGFSPSGAPYEFAFERDRNRLWFTQDTVYQSVLTAPLTGVELGIPCSDQTLECYPYERYTFDLFPYLEGAELRGIALSNPEAGPRRAYLAVRVYDTAVARSTFSRPVYDVAAALMVLDISGAGGTPPSPPDLLAILPVAIGASEIRVLPPRADGGGTKRDLVALTSTSEGVLTIYDDDAGVVVKEFGLAQAYDETNPAHRPLGSPLVGRQPFGLAVEQRADGRDWIYVAGFVSNTLTAVSLDPARPAEARIEWTHERVNP